MHEVDLSYNERDYIVLMNSSINFTLKAFIVYKLLAIAQPRRTVNGKVFQSYTVGSNKGISFN